jgi:heat shock protein HtpX
MKRVFLFLLTNLLVITVAGVVLRLLGVDTYLIHRGVDVGLPQLLLYCAVFGMLGSVISLLLSKPMAMRMVGAQLLKEPRGQSEQWLLETVRRHAAASGIGMPDVAVYQDPTPNAFATGARKNHALVAVSTGLLQRMKADEVDAVLGHEITHVANGDMVTLALIQGVVNTFVLGPCASEGVQAIRPVGVTDSPEGPDTRKKVSVLAGRSESVAGNWRLKSCCSETVWFGIALRTGAVFTSVTIIVKL